MPGVTWSSLRQSSGVAALDHGILFERLLGVALLELGSLGALSSAGVLLLREVSFIAEAGYTALDPGAYPLQPTGRACHHPPVAVN